MVLLALASCVTVYGQKSTVEFDDESDSNSVNIAQDSNPNANSKVKIGKKSNGNKVTVTQKGTSAPQPVAKPVESEHQGRKPKKDVVDYINKKNRDSLTAESTPQPVAKPVEKVEQVSLVYYIVWILVGIGTLAGFVYSCIKFFENRKNGEKR